MIIRAAVASGVELRDLVMFDEVSSEWIKASSHAGMIGSIIGIDDGATEAIIQLNSELQAYTSRDIMPHGGRLSVENGRVYVEAENGSMHRFVFPYSGEGLNENGLVPAGTLVSVCI